MKTGVDIYGIHYFLDLSKVIELSQLKKGMDVIMKRVRDQGLCKGRVVSIRKDSVLLCKPDEKPYSLFWKLTDRDLDRGVYIINKE